MTDLDRSIRVRALLDAWLPLVVLVFVVLAALSGFWVQQVYVQQDVEQQQRTVAQWSESTSYDHSAVITNESIAFNRSERVENRPVYYTSLVDDIDVTYRYEYTATGANGTVRVDTDTFIQYRGVEGETVLWSFTEPLASETAEGLEPGENQTVEVGVDVGSVLETIAEVEAQLGAAGTTEISVVSVSTVDGEVAGSRPLLDAADLTEKQATVLHAAYHHGYFERPRKSSATEIADSLGIVHSTFLQHLRTAQQKLFDGLYAPRDRN